MTAEEKEAHVYADLMAIAERARERGWGTCECGRCLANRRRVAQYAAWRWSARQGE